MKSLAERIDTVYETITDACARAGRDPAEVTLVAVSKRKPSTDILEALAAGVQHFAENRVEEAEIKIPEVMAQVSKPQPIWHMVGHIQSRKAKQVPPLFQVVHSVDRGKIARKLSEEVDPERAPLPIFLEVNIAGEDAKHGFDLQHWQTDERVRTAFWQEVEALCTLPNLDIIGLMTMAPFYENAEDTRPVFASLAALREALRADFALTLPDLSMGMTNDYPIAIEEGATIVRVGRAIFGPRD